MGHKGEVSFATMDETALLAMGILLEESAKEVLGKNGHMVFVEGEEREKPRCPTRWELEMARREKETEEREAQEAAEREPDQEGERSQEEPRAKMGRKRRKIRHHQMDDG